MDLACRASFLRSSRQGAVKVRPHPSVAGRGRQKILRTSTHLVRSRFQSLSVVRCRSVFRIAGAISPIQNPAYAPSSAHTRRIEFSCGARYVVRGNDQGTAGQKSSGGRRLTVSLSSKSEFARALVSMRKAPLAWSTVAMPPVSSWFPLSREPHSRRPPKRFKPDDARVRTLSHPGPEFQGR